MVVTVLSTLPTSAPQDELPPWMSCYPGLSCYPDWHEHRYARVTHHPHPVFHYEVAQFTLLVYSPTVIVLGGCFPRGVCR